MTSLRQPKRVLVFPCGSEIGLEINRAMRYSTHFSLVGASSVPDHGAFVYAEHVDDVPYVDAPGFIEAINDLVERKQIDLIFPGHDSVVLKLAEAVDAGNLRCQVVGSSLPTAKLARSKLQTYRELEGVIRVPTVFSPESVDRWPVFLKPDVGQGSKGTYLARTPDALAFYLTQDPTLIAVEYLPGPEYTIDCFTSNDGELKFAGARTRSRINNGISVNSSPVMDQDLIKVLAEMASSINEAVDLRGAWFFQAKVGSDGSPTLLEIAPRIAGTSGLARALGVNLPLLACFAAVGVDVDLTCNPGHVELDRALDNRYALSEPYRYVYIDFDDLILLRGRVNEAAVAFIFQCHNNGIPVHLVTRHQGDLPATLEAHRLSNLFSDISWIRDGSSKADYVTAEGAIFIDDSHTERRAVQERCGIPVFDTAMLEVLTDLRG